MRPDPSLRRRTDPSETAVAITGGAAGADGSVMTAPDEIRLGPEDGFPAVLGELSLVEVQVLHSRLSRQLDWEHCCDPRGPHPETEDRHQELVAELDARRSTLSRPGISE